jgi:hypothetical protein
MMQKYFNGIKTKMHVVGMACIDREIIKESTGRQNVVTKKDITKNKVVAESRKIIFRDDDYGVDSKSRFANIIDQIPLDTDEFIKALKDAIKAAKNNPISKKSVKSTPKSQPKEEVVEDESDTQIEDIDEIDDEIPFTEEDTTSQYPNNLSEVIRVEFKKCKDVNLKAKVREVIKPYGKLADVDEDGLKTIYDILKLKE